MVDEYGVYEFNPSGIVLGFKNQKINSAVHCYPMPASNSFFINSMSNVKKASVLNVFDSYGNKVDCSYSVQFTENDELIKVDISCLSDGLYIYQLINNFSQKAGKIIVIKDKWHNEK